MVAHRVPTTTPAGQVRLAPSRWRGTAIRRQILCFFLVIALGLAANTALTTWSLTRSWSDLDRESLDSSAFEKLPPVEADDQLVATADQFTAEGATEDPTSPSAQPDVSVSAEDLGLDDRFTTIMVVGSDDGDRRADVIILVLLPVDGSPPIMVSLPRDLYLPNRCTGGLTRINANFNGCGATINGATLLSGAVQDFTGLTVDHFVLFTMDGFERIIDAVGGVEVCVERPTREHNRFEFPAGCTTANGTETLGWVRSRKTEELVDGRWRTVPGVSDLSRNARQQELLLLLADRAASFSSPSELTRFAASLSDSFVLDDGLSLRAAIDLAWTHRSLDPDTIRRPTIPVRNHETPGGAQVLLPTASFAEVLAAT